MSALILGLAVASVWYEAEFVKRRPSLDTYVSLDHGGVRFEAYDFNEPSESYSIFVRTDPLQVRRVSFPSVQLSYDASPEMRPTCLARPRPTSIFLSESELPGLALFAADDVYWADTQSRILLWPIPSAAITSPIAIINLLFSYSRLNNIGGK